MTARFWVIACVLAAVSVIALPARAQEATDGADSGGEVAEDTEKPDAEAPAPTDGEEGDKKEKVDQDDKRVADAEKGSSPVEDPGVTYKFVGARYRYILVPSFMIKMFADGGTTVGAHSFGGEFGIRKDDFEYSFGLWYAAYSMDPTPFKAKSDGPDAWELVESNLKVLYLTADFMWSHMFTPEIGVNYGMGAGFGFVFGSLKRVQAYPVGDGFRPCVAPGNPHPYCGDDNEHYADYEEPSWANGGSKPIIFPWFALQTGLRYKAHRNFVARFDTGFGLSGFFFGLGADYGL